MRRRHCWMHINEFRASCFRHSKCQSSIYIPIRRRDGSRTAHIKKDRTGVRPRTALQKGEQIVNAEFNYYESIKIRSPQTRCGTLWYSVESFFGVMHFFYRTDKDGQYRT